MLTIAIRDFRAIERADFALDRLTLVAGPNGSGKSSICSALALAVTGQIVPPWLTKGEAGALVRTGQSAGGIKIKSPQGELTVAYPKASATANGTQPNVSPFAAGLVSIPDMDSKKRGLALAALLKTNPDKDDVAAAMGDLGFDQKGIDAIWKALQDNGWDATHKKAADHGVTLKGQWQQVTGEKYGSAKGGTWTPDGYSGDPIDQLKAELDDAQKALEAGIAATAVDQAKIEAWKAEADQLAPLTEERAAVQAKIDEAEAELSKARADLAALPPTNGEDGGVKCPHCEQPIQIKSAGGVTTLHAPPPTKPMTSAQIKAARERRAELEGTITNRSSLVLPGLRATLADIEGKLAVAKNAGQKLAEARADAKQSDEAPADIAALRTAHAEATKRLKAAADKAEADKIHNRIVKNQAMIDQLAPDGLRKRRTAKAVEAFNESILRPIWEAAKWKPVTVSETLDCLYGVRPYEALSESEQMRVRFVMQVACAQLDGSEILVMDRADLLDKGGRGGLVNLLNKAWGKPALVAMTYSDRNSMPPIDRLGGQAFWIDGGFLRPVERERAAA
jgi:hypothetical protein